MRRLQLVWTATLVFATAGLGTGASDASSAGATAVGSQSTVWVSAGSGTSGGREQPAMSADGRYVAYIGRSASGQGVYLHDQRTGTTVKLATGNDMHPAISPTGRYVAYVVFGNDRSVYMIDTRTGKATRESVATNGTPADKNSDFPSVSAGGRYVAFESMADNLGGPTASGGPNKVYVHDNGTGVTTMVSLTNTGAAPNGNAILPAITPDGRYVAFASDATNLLPGAATTSGEDTGSGHHGGGGGSGHNGGGGTGGSGAAPSAGHGASMPEAPSSTSAGSQATAGSAKGKGGNPGHGGTEPTTVDQVYVRDVATGTTTLASVSSAGVAGDGSSANVDNDAYGPTISDNGRLVAFESAATNLVPGDTNGVTDAFVHDTATGHTLRVSVMTSGTQAAPTPTPPPQVSAKTATVVAGADPHISGNGTTVAFESQAPLAGTDHDTVMDVYTYVMATGVVMRASVPAGGTTITGFRLDHTTTPPVTVEQSNGAEPSIDEDGRYVAFISNGDLTGNRPAPETGEIPWEAGVFVHRGDAPTVTGVSQTSVGLARTAVTETITGANFTRPSAEGDLSVTLGTGVTATSVTWLSPTTLQATIDVAWNARPGIRAVRVVDPGGDSGGMATCLTLTARGGGYRLVASDGGVFSFGDARFYGSMGGQHLNKPIVGLADSASGDGYWEVARDGGVFSFGDAAFYGSMGGQHLNRPIVGMASTPDGHGYWLVASDGGIFTFGDAAFYGSMGGQHLNRPIVGMAGTPDGHGYWLVASDGGIFTFGDAAFYGSMGGQHLNRPIVGMAGTPDGHGYWLIASDGGVFSFGSADSFGSLLNRHLDGAVAGMAAMPTGGGYWLVANDGGVFSFGSATFHGSLVGQHDGPVVAMGVE